MIHSLSAPYIFIYLHKIIFKFCVDKAIVYSACSEVHQSGDVKHVLACVRACVCVRARVRACSLLMELVNVTEISKHERR